MMTLAEAPGHPAVTDLSTNIAEPDAPWWCAERWLPVPAGEPRDCSRCRTEQRACRVYDRPTQRGGPAVVIHFAGSTTELLCGRHAPRDLLARLNAQIW